MSCWPAKLANGRSSAVADERTATGTSAPSRAYSAATASAMAGGMGTASTAARARSASAESAATSVGVCSSSSKISSSPSLLGRLAVGLRGQAEAGRDGQAGAGQLAEVARLAADHGEQVALDLAELEDHPDVAGCTVGLGDASNALQCCSSSA